MSQLINFGSWGVILIDGRVRPDSGDRSLKYYLEKALPSNLLDSAVREGFRHFEWLIVRDAQERLPEYSTQRCPAGFPIMTVLVVAKEPIDKENPYVLTAVKQALRI